MPEHDRPRGLPAILAWLYPLSYALHIAEEFWAREGFHRWLARVTGQSVTSRAFWSLNGIYWTLMVLVVAANARRPRPWVLPALATIVIVNGAGHAIGTAVTGIYSPGLVTGAVLWIPLGVWTLMEERHRATATGLRHGILAGLAIHAAVVAVAAAMLHFR